jgi:MFS family permease
VAVFVQFVAHGTAAALWVAHIPVVKGRLGLDDRALGLALFAFSAGAVMAMQAIGPLVRRTSTRTANRVSAVVLAGGLLLPAYATDLSTLSAALFVLGVGIGLLDVAMNAQAAEVEVAYRRPIMAAFHAAWSLSGMLGAALGGLLIRAGVPMSRTVGVGAVVVLAAALVASRWLLPGAAAEPAADVPRRGRRRLPGAVWLLGGLCFGSFMCEGAAADWAGVHLREDLGVAAGLAAFGYAAFAGAMTAGRLVVDRVAARVGSVPVLRYGGLLAVVGNLTVVLAPVPAVAIAGWALAGLGLSGIVPQLFSAAANTAGGDGPAALARVSSLGYLGTLVGPALIGLVAHLTGLGTALLLLVLLAGAVAVGAPAGLTRHRREPL